MWWSDTGRPVTCGRQGQLRAAQFSGGVATTLDLRAAVHDLTRRRAPRVPMDEHDLLAELGLHPSLGEVS